MCWAPAAEARMLLVRDSSLTYQAAVEKIAIVKLDARLRGQELEHTTSRRFIKTRREFQRTIPIVQDKVVIVFDLGAYGPAVEEIHRRPCYGFDLTSRNQIARNGSETAGIQCQ